MPRRRRAGPFTAAQVTAGHAAFLESCAACHKQDPARRRRSAIAGGLAFIGSWGKARANENYDVIKTSMPMGNAGSLAPESYQQIVAFILAANGATPGASAFTGDNKDKIASFATGKTPAGLLEAPVPASAARRRARWRDRPHGCWVVKNYSPSPTRC